MPVIINQHEAAKTAAGHCGSDAQMLLIVVTRQHCLADVAAARGACRPSSRGIILSVAPIKRLALTAIAHRQCWQS